MIKILVRGGTLQTDCISYFSQCCDKEPGESNLVKGARKIVV